MSSLLAWLVALPMRVVRLVLHLLRRLVQTGSGRAGSHERAMTQLRRRYPDAPDLWLEVVARNMSTPPDSAGDLAIAEAQGIASEEPVAAPPTGPSETIGDVERVPAISAGPTFFSGGRATLSRAVGKGGGSAGGMRTLSRQRPRWREVNAGLPTRKFPPSEPAASEVPAWRPHQQSPATKRRPLFSLSEASEVTSAFQALGKTKSADVLEADPDVAPSVRAHDPWPALPPRRGVHETSIMATSLPRAGSSRWQDAAEHDRWPALLPEASQPRNARSSFLGERIARLRIIQERL